MNKEIISLSPKIKFTANHAIASAHADLMASPQFQSAAATALLEYQYRVCPSEPGVLAIAASKLKGAQEFLAVLMNLGIPDQSPQSAPDFNLTPPEQTLDRPFNPPIK